MNAVAKQVLKILAAILLLIAGVAGVVLPIIPGIPLCIAGLVMLGVIEKRHLQELKERLKLRKR